MKKRNVILTAFFLLTVIPFIASAQKLPNVQETSLHAPAAIKVDGKPTEWNNQFQAYNKATEIFYTISNDNDKLYLTLQATDLDIINKIICRGITLTINGTGKMKDQEGMAITFPVLNESTFGYDSHGTGYMSPPINLDKPYNWPADSFMVALNKDFSSKAKDIKVIGLKDFTSSLISIYNPEGIKAVALFDNKTIFTYELAVPLKYLGLSVNNPKSFVYNIKLVSMNVLWNDPNQATRNVGGALRVQRQEIRKDISLHANPDRQTYYITGPSAPRLYSLVAPTDFWGEYTLAK